MRNAPLVAGQKRQHVAGWWGGAGQTVGGRYPRLWCAWGTSDFCSFCSIVAKNIRGTACAALTVRCILSENKTCVCLMGPDQDPRDVKRVTGA